MAAATFHTLTVADVEELTDDAVAVTFEVPDDLAGEFAFVPGQSLTLRRTVDGREERRQYSICAPAGGRPRVGVREIPDGLFSRWLVRDVRPGDHGRGPGARAAGSVLTRRCSRAVATSASRPAPASRRCSRWRAACSTPTAT